ncbi:glycoside hydrolase family 97 catalytic domain-containing protein [Flavobacterium sp. MMLR14_040]|uniref:glycoside hydrolase family 97 protein n=1 Tax=Flavobacterium sp. MMLR14_040 TaxID=3093843 RepID=UPI00298F6398|nr:glycoside hydrolase family 97 catalytic domain-containing protein [Flavobacterium sp. MMLR14_040]MDW8852163.1 glycoside hydrolase family 97 catalytic domain-containing protein [Flavobacterium sp. MMLR14_040]
MSFKSVICFCLFSFLQLNAQSVVKSPDGKLKVSVLVSNGMPLYSITYNEKTFLENSPLGLKTNTGDFTTGLSLKSESNQNKIDETYQLPNIKQSKVYYEANEAVFSFTKESKPAIDVIFRVSNNNVAFKYKIHPQKEIMSCVVEEEASGFMLPQGTTTFLCPQSKPMTGFARSAPSYETSYALDDAMGKNGIGEGYTFPCLFKVNNNSWVLISETGVDGNYCGSRLIGREKGLYTIGFPMAGENNGNGTTAPGIALPGETPWRTITVGETLNPIVETTIPFDLVQPKYKASKEYQYTKGTWSWIIKMDNNTTFPVQKQYIDFSNALGYETILVDALWDTQIGKDKIVELAEYGKSKNVGLYLWYNSNGYWNDAPQGPRGKMDNAAIRRAEMAWMKSIGVKGIKVDFFGGDKQVTMKLYEDILTDANDFGLMVIFHGCTLPRGWERMYPNYAASEAVLASENLHFGQESCDNEAKNAATHTFIRNTVGSMDFGGSALNEFYNSDNIPNKGSKRMTSDVFALATAVLFQSGVQHFALAPNNLTDAPDWAINFMKEVPTTWDEVRFLDGYPGKYVVFARRKGNKWYIAGVNAQKETIKLQLKLPMIASGSALKVYSDDENLNGKAETIKLKNNQEVEIKIPNNGGVLLMN